MTDYSLMAYLLVAAALALTGGIVLALRRALHPPHDDPR